MHIFTIDKIYGSYLQQGTLVDVLRSKDWSYLPAIRWADDKIVDNVLPVRDPGLYGWWEVLPTGGIRQILRHSYNEPGQYGIELDSYLLQTEDEFVVGQMQVVGSVRAVFEVLAFCKKDIYWRLSNLLPDRHPDKRSQIDQIKVAGNFPSTTFGRGDYRIHFEGIDSINWERLKELIDKLPHGAGWNSIWNIYVGWDDVDYNYKVFITYDTFDDVGYVVPVDMGWNLIDKGERWSVEEFIEEELPEDYVYLEEDLAQVLEDSLNANI